MPTPPRVPSRILDHRRPLPSGRAVTGGLLVVLALVGTWQVAADDPATPAGHVLVAARRLAPGDAVGSGEVRSVAADVPASVRAHLITDPAALDSKVALASIEAGDVISRSVVGDSSPVRGARDLSFVVETDWAAGGGLAVGDHIDVLVTYGDGPSSSTTRVLADVPVLRIGGASREGLGGAPAQTITVPVVGLRRIEAATNAARAGTLTVVRSTGAVPASDAAPYRPDAGTAAAGADSPAVPVDPGATTSTIDRSGRPRHHPANAGAQRRNGR